MDQRQIIQTLQMALRHHQAGDLAHAEPLYRQVLATQPANADALHLLGVLLRQRGDARSSVALIERAIAALPGCAEYHNHLAEALRDAGQTDRAIENFQCAIRLNTTYAEPHVKLADLYQALGQLEAALGSYRAALTIQPAYPEALNNYGNALRKLGKHDEAAIALHEAIRLRPDLPEPHNNLALVLRELGRLDEAQAQCQNALRLRPDYPEALSNLGNLYFDRRQVAQAIDSFRRSLDLGPDSAITRNNLAAALEQHGLLDGAEKEYRRAIALAPTLAEAHTNLGSVLRQQARHDQAIAAMRRAVELAPNQPLAQSNLLYSLHFDPDMTGERILQEHRAWAVRFADPLTAGSSPIPGDHVTVRPLRVGFVSPDFYLHSVGRFLLPLFQHRDRDQLSIICYSGVRFPDALTQRLRELADEWHSTVGISDRALVDMIRAHRLDVLIDLTLHSADNRILLFAHKPAPLQITWLGYPGTTGLAAMDYRLTDDHLDPARNDPFYVEKSLRLRTYWCYQPPQQAPQVATLPAQRNGLITFGCLNNFAKLNDRVLICWAKILAAVDRSRLLLLAGEGSHRRRVQELFASQGVAAHRIEFTMKLPMADYPAIHNRIDIALDPFPYTGGTTTCDALWMGLPVVTLAGETAVQRGGVSLITCAALSDWITSNDADYITRAVQAAADLPSLATLRRTMRDRLLASPLMDASAYARDFEHVLRSAHSRKQEGRV